MISFMVIGYPRSGTAWAANWLTTEFSLCLHDPLLEYRYDQLDQILSVKRLGIACTGLARFPAFLNNHPAPKIILHRALPDVQRSLREIGLPELTPEWDGALERIKGMHVTWDELFDNPVPIWMHLLPGQSFDMARHRLLKQLNVQVALEKATPNREAVRHYLQTIRDLAR